MRKRRSTNEQMIATLKDAEAGVRARDVRRRHGMNEQNLQRWKAKYGGNEASEARRLKEFETCNCRLKRIVTVVSLDNQAFKDIANTGGEPGAKARRGRAPAGGVPLAPAALLQVGGPATLHALHFLRLRDAREFVEAYRLDHNAARPHTSLGGRTPEELATVEVGTQLATAIDWRETQAIRTHAPAVSASGTDSIKSAQDGAPYSD